MGLSISQQQGSISSMFYKQLLHVKIPKAKKKTVKLSIFFVLLGSAHAKAASRMLMKLTLELCLTKVHNVFLRKKLFYYVLGLSIIIISTVKWS